MQTRGSGAPSTCHLSFAVLYSRSKNPIPNFLKENMSIPFSGTYRRSGGVVSAIGKQLKSVNLKAAKRITVKFDPFGDNVTHTRWDIYF